MKFGWLLTRLCIRVAQRMLVELVVPINPCGCVFAREAEDVQGFWETLFWSLWVEVLCPEGTIIQDFGGFWTRR